MLCDIMSLQSKGKLFTNQPRGLIRISLNQGAKCTHSSSYLFHVLQFLQLCDDAYAEIIYEKGMKDEEYSYENVVCQTRFIRIFFLPCCLSLMNIIFWILETKNIGILSATCSIAIFILIHLLTLESFVKRASYTATVS